MNKQIQAIADSKATAKACPNCGNAPRMCFNSGMANAYRYEVECESCEVWSWAASAKRALAKWNSAKFDFNGPVDHVAL